MTTQAALDLGFDIWKSKLGWLLGFYEDYRARVPNFFPKLFLFFIVLNIACYWLAIVTAFPERVFSAHWLRYVLIQFPVGVFGALFDSFSFFVTVFIIRRAVRAKNKVVYLGHLSIDLVIAVLATMWVLIVFSVSTWMVDTLAFDLGARPLPPTHQIAKPPPLNPSAQAPQPIPMASKPASAVREMPLADESFLTKRSQGYKRRFADALADPFKPENLKNIYFGLFMGASAMLPSLTHIVMLVLSVVAFVQIWRRKEQTG